MDELKHQVITKSSPAATQPDSSPGTATGADEALRASAANFAATAAAAAVTAPKSSNAGELMASFIGGGAGRKSGDEDFDFDSLIADIKNNPERVLKTDLTPEHILELQKRINPYAFIPGGGSQGNGPELVRSVATSYTNLREDYIRRFTMTSLIGFLFQILDEWAVPPEVRRWVPHSRKKKGGAAADPAMTPFDPAILVGKLEAALMLAKEAQKAKEENEAALQKTKEEMAVDDKSATAAQAKAISDATAAKAAGLLYAATNVACRTGLDAEKRIDATVEEASKYPDVKTLFDRSNVRADAGSTVEVPAELAKGIITHFFKHWLKYDPNVHVKAARDGKADASRVEIQTELGAVAADKDDPARLPLDVLLAGAPKPTEEDADFVDIFRASRGNYTAGLRALLDRELAAALIHATMTDENADRFRRYLYPIPEDKSPGSEDDGREAARKALEVIPPQDTFHRWGYYTEVNYEELRVATECLYNEKPDLDWAIGLWEMWDGTKEEVQKKFDQYCERYQDEVPSSIKKLDFGSWSLLGDFKKGRENIKFYNKHTEVLKRIMDRHTEDKKLGADLMRKRVTDLKAKNIAEAGPDPPGLNQYKKTATTLPALGAEKVIDAVAMRRLEKARGNVKAARELEVLEQNEAKVIEFGKIAASRPLTQVELSELHSARLAMQRAIESMNVPDDALQVDTFTHDTKTGEFTKTHFYTKAEKPEHMEQIRQEMAQQTGSNHPIARRQAAQNAASRLPGILEEISSEDKASGAKGAKVRADERMAPPATTVSTRPDNVSMEDSEGESVTEDKSVKIFDAGSLAPFAIQYMKLQEERTNADRIREAKEAAAESSMGLKESGAGAGTTDIQLPGTNITVPIPAGSVAVVVESIPDSAPTTAITVPASSDSVRDLAAAMVGAPTAAVAAAQATQQ